MSLLLSLYYFPYYFTILLCLYYVFTVSLKIFTTIFLRSLLFFRLSLMKVVELDIGGCFSSFMINASDHCILAVCFAFPVFTNVFNAYFCARADQKFAYIGKPLKIKTRFNSITKSF